MRLIDADALIAYIKKRLRNEMIIAWLCRIIGEVPTIEADPVRHGEWVLGDVEPGYFTPGGNRPWICSECGQVVSWMLGKPNEKYCPNCGAKMRGESDE